MKSESIRNEIAKRVRRIRQKKGMPQTLVAEIANLSRTSITNLEAGRQSMTLDNLYQIADSLQCSIYDLLPPSEFSTETNQRETFQFNKRLAGIKELAECIVEECS